MENPNYIVKHRRKYIRYNIYFSIFPARVKRSVKCVFIEMRCSVEHVRTFSHSLRRRDKAGECSAMPSLFTAC